MHNILVLALFITVKIRIPNKIISYHLRSHCPIVRGGPDSYAVR